MTHLLVTNDYPPKLGGIQNYLWEIYRRLPADEFAILTTPYAGAEEFDRGEPYRIERYRRFWLTPTPGVRSAAEKLISEIDASCVVFDPALPVGRLGPSMSVPYAVVLHGAEVTVPARIPGPRQVLARTVRDAAFVVSASGYALHEAEEALGGPVPSVYVPPGVDTGRFRPLDDRERTDARAKFGVASDAPLIVSVSRLVPRKGMDRLIEASAVLAQLHPGLRTLIAGSGRDRSRLDKLVQRTGAPVTFLGRVADAELPELIGCADAFAMLCRNRWGGLEQEGFGIVFVEAAAAGVASVAGASGGAAEAVAHGETGFIVQDPSEVSQVVSALDSLLSDESLRNALGAAGRERSLAEFDYDLLAERYLDAIHEWESTGRPTPWHDGQA